MDIVQYPASVLTTPAQKFKEDEGEEIKRVADALRDAYAKLPVNKLGLAAPQIGIGRHMAICLGTLMMHMEFTPAKQKDIQDERCFSVEKASVMKRIWRPSYGWAKYTDPRTMKVHEEKISGLRARIFQHELDHLSGVSCLFKE